MARHELAHGANPQTKTLAQAIIAGQSAEITQMKADAQHGRLSCPG
jgi:uncharacterized protein (DUF305 family)